MAIASSIMCMMIVILYWISTLLSEVGSYSYFADACLNPNGLWTLNFSKWWIFTAIIGVTNGLSIGLCAAFYIWLSLEINETTLVTTKVGIFKVLSNHLLQSSSKYKMYLLSNLISIH
jgi:hypothetical protein